jgi:hypothetical protein
VFKVKESVENSFIPPAANQESPELDDILGAAGQAAL